LLRASRSLLELTHGPGAAREPITVTVAAGPVASVSTEEPAPPAVVPPPPEELPPLHRDILAALGSSPLPGKALASRAGRPYNSRFREAMAALVEVGHARRARGGYSRPLPPAAPAQ
jgi:hypothetical protein